MLVNMFDPALFPSNTILAFLSAVGLNSVQKGCTIVYQESKISLPWSISPGRGFFQEHGKSNGYYSLQKLLSLMGCIQER